MMMTLLTRYAAAKSGATAVVYAIAALPLLAGAGLMLDMGRLNSGKMALTSAVDAAVLAGARDLSDATKTDTDIQNLVSDYFATELQTSRNDISCPSIISSIDRTTNKLDVTATCTMATTMTGIVGLNQFEFSADAQAQANITLLDLALVVDVSGSMSGSKLSSLQTAADLALDKLITPQTGDRVRVSLVPYSTSVNIGGTYDDLSFDPSDYDDGEDSNCATDRAGAEAFTSAKPDAGQWFGYATADCPSQEFVPLTNNKSDLSDAIDDLTAGGGTAGHLGLSWGWYTISPNWNDLWPTDSDALELNNKRIIKAIILMTDGQFNTSYEAANGDSPTQALAMCDNIKAENILIFSVAFQAPTASEALLETCASDPSMFFDASSGTELQDAYETIASKLSELRLSQ